MLCSAGVCWGRAGRYVYLHVLKRPLHIQLRVAQEFEASREFAHTQQVCARPDRWALRNQWVSPECSQAAADRPYPPPDGILRTVETTAATSQTDMEDALHDFEALTVKWRDMVKLAQDLNERLTASSLPDAGSAKVMTTQAVEPEEATFIRSSLAQLGLQMANAPVTLDMVRDERRWVDELARELAGILQGSGGGTGREGLMRRRGVVGLDEVWGGWNRARGVGAY